MTSPAREAGESIKPGVERGFASGTPGTEAKKISAREAGDRGMSLINCCPLRGLSHHSQSVLGFGSQSLALPRLYAVACFAGSAVTIKLDPLDAEFSGQQTNVAPLVCLIAI